MKVGIFLSGSLKESGGGYTYEQEIFQATLQLANTTTHSYTVFCTEDIPRQIRRYLGENIQFIRIPKNNFFVRILEQLFLSFSVHPLDILYFKFLPLQDEIRKNNIDFMVFLNPIHEIVDIPSITPVWDLQHRLQPWFPEVSENGEWEKREKYYQKVLRRSSIILTGTTTGQEEISRLYNIPLNNIRIIPLPTPSDVLAYQKERNSGDIQKFHLGGDYLLYPAQFWPHKNHVACIQALKILHHQYHRRISLVFVGSDKKNLSYVQNYSAGENMSEFVHILGFIPRQDLIVLYQNAFALVFPTFFGPDNIPPLEAFALRCPIIASKVSGADEQLGDAALLFDPHNPKEIADAVEFLYSSPTSRAEYIAKGSIRATHWTSDDYARTIFSLLDEFEYTRRCWQ